MELSHLQSLWQQHETALTAQRKLNLNLLRSVKLDQAQSSLRRLLFLPVSSSLFFLLLATYALHFLLIHGQTWYYLLSGGLVLVFSSLLVLSSLRQLKRLLSVDYQAPVLELQRDLSRLKSAIVDNLRIAVWTLPFAPFVGVFFFKVWFGYDLVANQSPDLALPQFVVAALLGVGAWLLSRALRPGNLHKKWVNWLLVGSGSQVDEALGFIEEIQAFAREETQSAA